MPFFNLPPNDPVAALAYARLIRGLNWPFTAETISQALLPIMGGCSQRVVRNSANYECYWGAAVNNDTVLVFCTGIQTREDGRLVARSYLDPERNILGGQGSLQLAADNALRIKTQMTAFGIPVLNRFVCVGHSFGGVIASELQKILTPIGTQTEKQVCTFGSPKPTADPIRYRTIDQYARWVNRSDNVPTLPWLAVDAAPLYSMLTPAQRTRLQQWVQPCQSIQLNENGTIVVADDRSAPIVLGTDLANLMASPEGWFGAGHSLDQYIRLLQNAIPRFNVTPLPPPPPPATGNLPIPPLPTMTRSPAALPAPVVLSDMNARRVAFRDAATNNDAIPANVPTPAKMLAVREDGIWYVTWMDYYIAIGPTKKKARALCRHMNRFLPIFQGVGQCYGPNFVFALTDYLTAAADPIEEFSPTLNDAGLSASAVFFTDRP